MQRRLDVSLSKGFNKKNSFQKPWLRCSVMSFLSQRKEKEIEEKNSKSYFVFSEPMLSADYFQLKATFAIRDHKRPRKHGKGE
jgi:hypothetical protein